MLRSRPYRRMGVSVTGLGLSRPALYSAWLLLAWMVMLPFGGGTALADSSAVIQRTVVGHGISQKDAISDGLLQAIEQVNGVRLDHHSVAYKSYSDTVDDLKHSLKSSDVGSDHIHSASHGLIDSYKIIDQPGPDANGLGIQVQLRVNVLIFDHKAAARSGGRKIIAVIPFRTVPGGYQLDGVAVSGTTLAPELAQGLVQGLVQSRRFTVLDREFLAEMLGEQKLIATSNMPTREQVRIGQQLGADYLLVGRIDDAEAGRSKVTDPSTGQPGTSRSARVRVSYRVIDVATAQDHWADTFRRSYSDEALRGIMGSDHSMRMDDLLMRDAGSSISDQCVNCVFPIRVLDVQGNTAILSQGGRRVQLDERFDVFNQGKMLYDPDTHEPIEKVETYVGVVQVTRIDSKLAYATVISGDPHDIDAPGATCRLHAAASNKYFQSQEIDSVQPNTPGQIIAAPMTTALMVVGPHDVIDSVMGENLATLLRKQGLDASDSILSPAVVSGGLFQRMYSATASPEELRALDLGRRCSYLILGTTTSNLAAQPNLEGMVSGSGAIELRVLRTSDFSCVDHFRVSAHASAFSVADAHERLDINLAKSVRQHGFGDWVPATKRDNGHEH